MKISYKPVGSVSGTNYKLLLDTSPAIGRASSLEGGVSPEFSMGTDAVNVPSPTPTSSKLLLPMGNVEGALTLEFMQTYDSETAAMNAMLAIAAIMTTQFHLMVESYQGGTAVHFYPNCVCVGYKATPNGNSITNRMTLKTQLVTSVAPVN